MKTSAPALFKMFPVPRCEVWEWRRKVEAPIFMAIIPWLVLIFALFILVKNEEQKEPFISRVERERRELKKFENRLSLILEGRAEIEGKILKYFPKALEIIPRLKTGEEIVLLENDTYYMSVKGKTYFVPDGYEYYEGEWCPPCITFTAFSSTIFVKVKEAECKKLPQVYKKLVEEVKKHVACAEDSLALAIKVEKGEV